MDEIKNAVPPDSRVYMEDLSGRLALLSGRLFVSGDGLVNSNEYLHSYIIPGRVNKYLQEKQEKKEIGYFLTSNIQCYPYRKRMPWTRDVEITEDGNYKVVVDVRYATRLPVTPSVLYFPPESLVFDKCYNGIRELLFRLPDTAPEESKSYP